MKKYEKIIQRITTLIENKAIPVGQKVPSIRTMACQTGFSLMTVMEAYRRLEDRGWIESRPQSGYYVVTASQPQVIRCAPEARAEFPVSRAEPVRLSSVQADLTASVARNDILPLGIGLPHSSYYPSLMLARVLGRIIRRKPELVNRYCFEPGVFDLRLQLTRRMVIAGCDMGPDQIIITTGATQALVIGLQAATRPGDIVAVESPGYYGYYPIMEYLQLQALEIPSDPQTGLMVPILEKKLQEGTPVRCVLVSASHANPTGATMPEPNKQALIDVCTRYDLPIIEDDVYGDLAYPLQRPRSLKSYDLERVLYVSSLSKTVSPGYRIGWIAAGMFHQQVLKIYRSTMLAASLPTQMAAASFLEEGGFANHLRSVTRKYQRNLDLFQDKIAISFPAGSRTSQPQGGYFLWVELPKSVDTTALAHRVLKAHISIAPGALFSAHDGYSHYLRLNYAVPWDSNVASAIETIGKLIYMDDKSND